MSEGAGSPPPTPMTPGPPDPDPVDDPQPMSLGRRAGKIIAVVIVASMAGLWLWAWFGPADRHPPGVLADKTFPAQAQQICTHTAGVIAALPPAYTSPNATARAAVIDKANAALGTMLDQLDAIAPPDQGRDGTMIHQWLTDFRTYLGDRITYANALRQDPNAHMLVTEKAGQQITEPIQFFATYNHMDQCVPPGDLA